MPHAPPFGLARPSLNRTIFFGLIDLNHSNANAMRKDKKRQPATNSKKANRKAKVALQECMKLSSDGWITTNLANQIIGKITVMKLMPLLKGDSRFVVDGGFVSTPCLANIAAKEALKTSLSLSTNRIMTTAEAAAITRLRTSTKLKTLLRCDQRFINEGGLVRLRQPPPIHALPPELPESCQPLPGSKRIRSLTPGEQS